MDFICVKLVDGFGNISYLRRYDSGRVQLVSASLTPSCLSNATSGDAAEFEMYAARCTGENALLAVAKRYVYWPEKATLVAAELSRQAGDPIPTRKRA